MASTSRITYWVSSPPDAALAHVRELLSSQGFACTDVGPAAFSAELGSKVKAALLGAFSLYMKLDVAADASPDGTGAQIFVTRGSSGMMGGAIGMSRTNSKLAELDQMIMGSFGAAVVGRQEI